MEATEKIQPVRAEIASNLHIDLDTHAHQLFSQPHCCLLALKIGELCRTTTATTTLLLTLSLCKLMSAGSILRSTHAVEARCGYVSAIVLSEKELLEAFDAQDSGSAILNISLGVPCIGVAWLGLTRLGSESVFCQEGKKKPSSFPAHNNFFF